MKPPPHARRVAPVLVLLALLLSAGLRSAAAPAAESRPRVVLLELDGVINPPAARYLTRELERARAEAHVVVVRLDTPGGLMTSMRDMTQALLASPVPVVVWVGPAGARAASAGVFVTMAAHVAAMAPGTNIGAAHPVGLGGGGDSVQLAKATSDAAAQARAIAQARGRNADWAERAVRESVSLSATEALDANVIDLLAADLDALLLRLDGRRVATPAGEVTLRTAGARVERAGMSLPERLLGVLADPNVAYVLFTLGLIGLIAELYSPGLLIPGIVGAVALVLAFAGFGSLPIDWAGVALLILAAGLLVAELLTAGFGVLGAGGVIAFLIGSLLLYEREGPALPAAPDPGVSLWLVGVMTALLAGFLLLVVRALVRVRGRPVATGIEALRGRSGRATSDLAPEGTVRVDSESWHARSAGGAIRAGDEVRVVDVEGVTLWVTRRAGGPGR